MKGLNIRNIRIIASFLYIVASIIHLFDLVILPYRLDKCSVLLLSLAIFLIPNKKEILPIGITLLLSVIGDIAGEIDQFIVQMFFFALAHISYMCYFIPLAGKSLKRSLYTFFVICMTCVIYMSYTIPHIKNPIEKYGMIVYSMIISCMLLAVWLSEGPDWYGFVSAAILFVLSDGTIGYNKFISPIKYQKMIIMGTYYAAQYLFWFFALKREIRCTIVDDKIDNIILG